MSYGYYDPTVTGFVGGYPYQQPFPTYAPTFAAPAPAIVSTVISPETVRRCSDFLLMVMDV